MTCRRRQCCDLGGQPVYEELPAGPAVAPDPETHAAQVVGDDALLLASEGAQLLAWQRAGLYRSRIRMDGQALLNRIQVHTCGLYELARCLDHLGHPHHTVVACSVLAAGPGPL
jgi:hypothetical protein